jgi:hypothetical protein
MKMEINKRVKEGKMNIERQTNKNGGTEKERKQCRSN